MIKTAGDFTCKLWKDVNPIYKKMLVHPFIKGLQKGDLSKKAFKYYLSQDILYLKDDLKAFKNLTKKIKNKKHKKFFKNLQKDMIIFEEMFEFEHLKKLHVKKAKQKSKVIKKYTSFLLKTSKNSSTFYALCALLPCFWLYSAVGLEVYKKAKKQNRYKDWIEFYKDEKLIKQINIFIKIVEKEAQNLNKKERKKARKYFLKSSFFELAFFDESIKKGKI